MKVYQMIYTSVKHSIAEPELGLVNQPGQRVYSCSQGLTRENIAELMRFSSYRLPKNDNTKYPQELGNPSVPDMFPKVFRTLRLADGRFAAIQSVYAGNDVSGDPGNFFAHSLVFDECPDDFFPEQYFGSELFRTYLSQQEQDTELVRYMPVIENPPKPEGLEDEIVTFIKLHKKELTYLVNHAVGILTSESMKNICICTDDEYLTERYLLALKWLIPRDIARNTGISTYNVYLPSDKQDRIVFHGTIEGKNNIEPHSIESRENCLYVDFKSMNFDDIAASSLFNLSVEEIRAEYNKYKLSSVSAYNDWFALTQNITYSGMGGKLLKFKRSAGDEAFVIRAKELFERIDDESMADVRFEITKVMYDNIELFDKEVEKITDIYILDCLKQLCTGENYDIESVLNAGKASDVQLETLRKSLPKYMELITENLDNMGEKNQRLIMNFLVHIKRAAGYDSWAEMVGGKHRFIAAVLELAVPDVITGYGAKTFSVPNGWTPEELYEIVAYIERATEDKRLSMGCLKFINDHENVDWTRYGITIGYRKKMPAEVEADSAKIRRLLTKVGYEPYQRNSYSDIKRDIMADVEDNRSPLLVSRLLATVYAWQGAYGDQREAQRLAEKIRKYILELREKEPQCYNYMISKLAIEILESPGHYHEIMVNTNTMPESFWYWFLMGAEKNRRDDKKQLAFIRVYENNKMKLQKLPIKPELRKHFKDER